MREYGKGKWKYRESFRHRNDYVHEMIYQVSVCFVDPARVYCSQIDILDLVGNDIEAERRRLKREMFRKHRLWLHDVPVGAAA